MKKSPLMIVIAVVILAIVGYGGYKVLHHFTKTQSPMMPVTTTTTSPTSTAPSSNIYMTKTDATKGLYLTDFAGMTLYIFDKDTAGVSTCTGNCAKIWLPYTSGATAQGQFPTNITVITRADGTKQLAWKGMPVYYYSSDQKVRDLLADGVGGMWHIVKH